MQTDFSEMNSDGFNDDFERIAFNRQRAEVLSSVFLYDEDEEARAKVDEDDYASVYSVPRMRGDESLHVLGRDLALTVDSDLADMPMDLAQRAIERVADEGRRNGYRERFNQLGAMGGDTAQDYYRLYAQVERDNVQGAYRAQKQKLAAMQESVRKLELYVRGDDMVEGGAESFSEQDLANVRSVVDKKTLDDATAVRNWMQTYVKPLSEKTDAEEMMRTLDGLEDEFFEVIGQDAQRAEMAYMAMMHWAEGVKQSNKVGVADELIVAVGKKLSNWADPRTGAIFATQGAIGPAGAINPGALQSASSQIQSAYKDGEERRAARSILRAAINKGMELGDDVNWWVGTARTAAQMTGDTLPYLLPYVGPAVGTLDVFSTGLTETADQLELAGLSGAQAGGQALIETGVQAAVELMPFGKVGGWGLSKMTRRFFGESMEQGRAGKFARWVVRNTQKSTARALLAEGAASFADEAILEPVAGGIMTYGAEHTFDMLGVPHGRSREFYECFDELKTLFTDPHQAAGLLLFTAGLTGAGAYGVHQNVKYFARHRKMWEAAGLTPEQVDKVMAADDSVAVGSKMVDEGWQSDPVGMRKRVLEVCGEMAERGEVLVLTGEGALDAELENSELAEAYRAVWQEYQERGLLPKVEAVGNNQFRITKEGVDITLDAKGADAYLQHAIDEVDIAETRELQKRAGKGHYVDLRSELATAVSKIAGGAAMRAVEATSERSGIAVEDLTRGLPEFLAEPIRQKGMVTLTDAQNITEWALGVIDGLVQEGMSPADARMTRPTAQGMARSLGDWATFARDFAHRERLAGYKRGEGAITIGRTRNSTETQFDGKRVLGQTLMTIPGQVRHFGAVEDVTESFFDMLIQERAAVLLGDEVESATAQQRADAEAEALKELGDIVKRARAAVVKADPSAAIEEVTDGDKMSIIEALSTMATSKFLTSGVVPKWMQSLTQALVGNLEAAEALSKVRTAYAGVMEKEPAAVSDLENLLNRLGVHVQDVFREARIEAVDIQAWKSAQAITGARAAGAMGSGGAAVSAVKAEAEEHEDEIVRNERMSEPEPEVAPNPTRDAKEAREVLQQMAPAGNAPADMKGVFVDDQCYYNQAGGFWCGMIRKSDLRDGTEQVKIGQKGKHGVIAGKELTGRFQHSVGAIYVWRRKNGELQVISGRHRFAKLMEDAEAEYCNAYVFNEDEEHDERWARMLDYENNMRDDQADELTAATYVRETGLTDAELKDRGLMRNGTRCKRGALIGRFARQELWTRFKNGVIEPKDAEIICNLTRNISRQERIEEIQTRCCMLLEVKKSWEFIGGMVQLMANKEMVTMKQGLLDFGADFEADLARAAEWIERNIKAINESITLLKQGKKLSGKKRAEAERLGITTATQEGAEEMLRDLEMLKGQFELIGSYPDLIAQAQMWDGKTEVDPVGRYLEQAHAEREQAAAEGEMDADEYLAEQARKEAAEAVPTLFSMEMGKRELMPNQIKVKNKVIVTFKDGVVRNPKARVLRSNGSEVWGYVPEIPELKAQGFSEGDVFLEVGNLRSGLLHDIKGHGEEIQAMYPDRPFYEAYELFIDELFAKLGSMSGHYSGRGKVKRLEADSKLYDKGGERKKKRVALDLKANESGKYYLIHTAFETYSQKPFTGAKGKDGLTCTVTVELDGEVPGLPTSSMPTPSHAWQRHARRPIQENSITPDSEVKLKDIDFDFLRKVKHPDVETGARVKVDNRKDGEFSANMERNLAAVHSLSPEKFLGALELGGMPMPSVAITRLDRPYGWGSAGNIVLVGRPALVDPKTGAEVYSRDAWTGNFPRVVHKVIGKKERSDSVSDLRDMRTKYQASGDYNSDIHQLDYRINMDYGGEQTSRSDMDYGLRQRTGKALFAWQSGYQPRPKTKEATRVHEWLTKEVASRLRRYVSLSPDEYHEKWPEIKEEVRQEIEKVYRESSVIKKAPTPEAAEKRLTSWVNVALRSFDAYSPSALEKELEDVKKIGARVLDIEANLDMLAKYADKHKTAYEEWIVQKLNAWFSKECYIHGTKKEATLDNLAEYMLGKKSRGEETGLAFSSGRVRAYQAERLYSMDDIRERRESLIDSEASNVMKAQTHECMSEWREGVADILARGGVGHDFSVRDDAMETLSKVKGTPTAEKLRAAVRKMFRGASNLQALLNDTEVINTGVEALKSLHAELEDYMEAVPQRAVRMNEWEYAVMPEGLKKNKAVMAGLREHGIKPRFHDGTEEGRKAALAGLVNDSTVSFNVIGPRAKTWPKYVDRAFAGRDDGNMRAEIDASRAKLTPRAFLGDAGDEYRLLVAGKAMPFNVQDDLQKLREQQKLIDGYYHILFETDDVEKALAYNDEHGLSKEWFDAHEKLKKGVRDFVIKQLQLAGVSGDGKYGSLSKTNSRLIGAIMESLIAGKVNEDVAAELDKMSGGYMKCLKDVLDYEELYEAYPDLKWLPVGVADLGYQLRGQLTVKGDYPDSIMLNERLDNEGRRSTLLHEIQHAIQTIEEFARGGTAEMASKLLEKQVRQYRIRLEHLRHEQRWLYAVDTAKDHLERMLRLYKRPRAILKMGERFAVHEMQHVPTMAAQALDMMWKEYAEMSIRDYGDSVAYAPGNGYKLPGRGSDTPTQAAVERLLEKVKALPSRRSGTLRGRRQKVEAEIERLYEENKHKLNMTDMSGSELYLRLAGEIESRNVQERRDWSMAERMATPFNETLEYPGEALVTHSMERASMRALDVLRGRADERAGETLIKDWQRACEAWNQLAGDDEGRLGNGAKMLGEMQALIGATKGVLPQKYCRMGHLNGLMRWAGIYARMQQDGELPKAGVIKGPIYQKFVERMQKGDELNRVQGMSEAEAKEAIALLAGERLDVAMLKVANECRRRLELFLKDREKERIDWIVERAYPKRQRGQQWPRGKMAAEAYRRMERAYELMKMQPDDLAELIKETKRKLSDLDSSDEEFEAKEEALEDELFLAQTFGAWDNMSFEQARRASGAMAEMVLAGRNEWQEKLRGERRRADYDRRRIAGNFKTSRRDSVKKRAKDAAKEKANRLAIGQAIVRGGMSYAQLMLALEPKLGKEFTGRQIRMIAKAHEEIQLFNQERSRWMYKTLSAITGLKKEGEIEEWINANNEIFDTGIVLTPKMVRKCRLTPEEAREWLAMTAEERAERRAKMLAEAEARKEEPDNIPEESQMDELRRKLAASEENGTMPREYELRLETKVEQPLHCTKEALLFAILTFEQDDYKRLMEVNGVTEAQLKRMRELVGPKLLAWGYAMRDKLSEHGERMAELYEAYTGVPFAKRANYFRGVFDNALAKDNGEAIDVQNAITGGKYGIIIPRQYHNQKINWSTSATQVGLSTLNQQQNYISTAHITREWRTLLSNQEFEKRMRAEIGDTAMNMIHGWTKLIDGSVMVDAKVQASFKRFFGRLLSAYAVGRLAGNVYTVMKQGSALLNGLVGGRMPERVLENNAVVQQMTYRHIGVGEYLGYLAKAMSGRTEIRWSEIEAAGYIAGRKQEQGHHLEQAAMLAPGQKVPSKLGRKGRAVYEGNMELIGWADRKSNTVAALAVAEAVYQQAKAENKDGMVPDAELRRVAIQTAGLMIELAAQPQLRTQKNYWAASGALGALGDFFFMFKSEALAKMGVYIAQMFAGNHKAWLAGWLSFGVANSLVLALIDYIRGYWPDDDDEDKWQKRGLGFLANVLFLDITSVPVLGDFAAWAQAEIQGEKPWRSSIADMMIPFGDIWNAGKREVKNIRKAKGWDEHVAAMCSLARALGTSGGWVQNGRSVPVGTCAELALATAAISNIVRFGKDAVKFFMDED